MGERTSIYLADDLGAAVKASGVPLAELIRRGLAAGTEEADSGPVAPPATTAGPVTLPAGEPSPGVICMTPRCFQRDTSRYGLRGLPLCPACAAALQGQAYERPLTAAQARALGHAPAA